MGALVGYLRGSDSKFLFLLIVVLCNLLFTGNAASQNALGPVGGPFVPDPVPISLSNQSNFGATLNVSSNVNWVSPSLGSFFIPANGTVNIAANFQAAANSLPNGVHTAVFTYTQSGSFITSHNIILTVDGISPVINGPGNLVFNAPPGATTQVVNYNISASDNITASPTLTLLAGIASGSAFPIGVTTVTWRAQDEVGNISTHTFTVTVNPSYVLSVDGTGNGSGTVSATGISCQSVLGVDSGSCNTNLPDNDSLTLTATPAADSVFDSWIGCDNPSGNSCVQTINGGDETVQAVFTNAPPNVVITTGGVTSFNQSIPGTFVATVTFNEPVTGFTDGDLQATNANVGTLSPAGGSGTVFTAIITPLGTGNVVLSVPQGVALDASLNNNLAAANIVVSQIDDVSPTVSILNAPESHDNSTQFTVTIEFSEDVTGFDSVTDVTVTNATLSNFQTIDGNTYTVDITPGGPEDITIDVAAGVAQDAAGNLNIAAVQVFAGSSVVEDTQRAIASFLINRANNVLGNQPRLTAFLDGTRNNIGGKPGSLSLNGDDDGLNLAFSTSLNRMLAQSDAKFSHAFNRNDHGKNAEEIADPTEFRNFDIWTEIYGATSRNQGSDSDFWIGYFGAHYFISDYLLFGAMAQLDRSDEENPNLGSKADGFGWMIGPYLAGSVPHQNLYYEARIAWGRSSNNVSPIGTYEDSFDTTRLLLSGAVSGKFDYNDLIISPRISAQWFEETQETYRDNLGNTIPEQTISIGELKFGPEISRNILLGNDTVIKPTLGVSGIWNFGIREGAVSQGLIPSSDQIRARIDGGIVVRNDLGWSISVAAYYDGWGADQYDAWGGNVKLSISVR